MKILMTGATGWLGYKLYSRLSVLGHDIRVICRDSSSGTKIHDGVFVLDHECEEKIMNFSPDVVLHTACRYDKKGILPDEIMEANFRLPFWLLRVAAQCKCRGFFAIGSNLPANLNFYTFMKRNLSEAGKIFVSKGLLSFTEILPEAFYDIDEPADRFLPRTFQAMLENREVLLPEGHRHRDYMWSMDLVNIITFLLTQDLSNVAEINNNGKTYSRIQVGSGEAPSVQHFATFIKDQLHSSSPLLFGGIPPRPNEPDSVADLTNLRKLGYDVLSMMSWQDGIRMLVKNKKG